MRIYNIDVKHVGIHNGYIQGHAHKHGKRLQKCKKPATLWCFSPSTYNMPCNPHAAGQCATHTCQKFCLVRNHVCRHMNAFLSTPLLRDSLYPWKMIVGEFPPSWGGQCSGAMLHVEGVPHDVKETQLPQHGYHGFNDHCVFKLENEEHIIRKHTHTHIQKTMPFLALTKFRNMAKMPPFFYPKTKEST